MRDCPIHLLTPNIIFYVAYVFFVIIWALEGHVKENQKIKKGYLPEKKYLFNKNYIACVYTVIEGHRNLEDILLARLIR